MSRQHHWQARDIDVTYMCRQHLLKVKKLIVSGFLAYVCCQHRSLHDENGGSTCVGDDLGCGDCYHIEILWHGAAK
jgi:hypothetical protein